MKPSWHAIALSLPFLLGASLPAKADVLLLSGASSGVTSDYAFAGAIVPFPGTQLGKGPAIRIWGDHLTYTYQAGAQKIKARGWGTALAGVYQFSGSWGWSNLSAGLSYRNTRLSPNDPGNSSRGGHTRLNLQADGGFNLDEDWRLRGLASYTPAIRDYLIQAGIDRSVTERLRLGLETRFQGDRNYEQKSAGAIAYIRLGSGVEFAPSLGVSHNDDGKTGVYGGLTFVWSVN